MLTNSRTFPLVCALSLAMLSPACTPRSIDEREGSGDGRRDSMRRHLDAGAEEGDDSEDAANDDVDAESGGDPADTANDDAAAESGGDPVDIVSGDGGFGDQGQIYYTSDSEEDEQELSPNPTLVVGDILYFLAGSQLHAVDISDPRLAKVLDRSASFEARDLLSMHMHGRILLAVFWDKVIAFDVANSADIKIVSTFPLDGIAIAVRLVGNYLYLVSDRSPLTQVLSLNVADPQHLAVSDVLDLPPVPMARDFKIRPILLTDQRVYLARLMSSATGKIYSSIQVLDTTHPNGRIVNGTEIRADGMVREPWQMDESAGVLRVVGQPVSAPREGFHGTDQATLQTFRVTSASDIAPVATLSLSSRGQRVRSIEFQGKRAYVALAADPGARLLTLDMEELEKPTQAAIIELPGSLERLVPRGDRLIALGFEQGNSQGPITVSLFDVADPRSPRLLSQVHFGNDWTGWTGLVREAFRVEYDQGLVLVPYARRTALYDRPECANWVETGVQLIDVRNDNLSLRGFARAGTWTERAFAHRGYVLAMDYSHLETYDISNPDQPATLDIFKIIESVSRLFSLGNGALVKLDTSGAFDIVHAGDAVSPDRPLSSFSLGLALRDEDGCEPVSDITAAFVRGTELTLVYSRYAGTLQFDATHAGVIVIDASSPGAFTITGRHEWDMQMSCAPGAAPCSGYNLYTRFAPYGIASPMSSAWARVGETLLLLEGVPYRYTQARLRVVDLSALNQIHDLVLPLQETFWSGLAASGQDVLLGHFEPDTDGVRFGVRRVDVSSAQAPTVGESIAVPGRVRYFDAGSARILTSALLRGASFNTTRAACEARFAYSDFRARTGDTTGGCVGYTEVLHLLKLDPAAAVLEDSFLLGEKRAISAIEPTDDALLVLLTDRAPTPSFRGESPSFTGESSGADAAELLSLSGATTGKLSASAIALPGLKSPFMGWNEPQLFTRGELGLHMGSDTVTIFDASDASMPRVVGSHAGLGSLRDVTFEDNSCFVASGNGRVERIALP